MSDEIQAAPSVEAAEAGQLLRLVYAAQHDLERKDIAQVADLINRIVLIDRVELSRIIEHMKYWTGSRRDMKKIMECTLKILDLAKIAQNEIIAKGNSILNDGASMKLIKGLLRNIAKLDREQLRLLEAITTPEAKLALLVAIDAAVAGVIYNTVVPYAQAFGAMVDTFYNTAAKLIEQIQITLDQINTWKSSKTQAILDFFKEKKGQDIVQGTIDLKGKSEIIAPPTTDPHYFEHTLPDLFLLLVLGVVGYRFLKHGYGYAQKKYGLIQQQTVVKKAVEEATAKLSTDVESLGRAVKTSLMIAEVQTNRINELLEQQKKLNQTIQLLPPEKQREMIPQWETSIKMIESAQQKAEEPILQRIEINNAKAEAVGEKIKEEATKTIAKIEEESKKSA